MRTFSASKFRGPGRAVSAGCGSSLVVLTAALLLSVAAPAAFAAEDADYTHYRCSVLGDSRACAPGTAGTGDGIRVDVVPGPYATYLIHLGQDQARAIEAARDIGEMPVLRKLRITTRPLTDLEKYERYQGRLQVPDVRREVLAQVPLRKGEERASRMP